MRLSIVSELPNQGERVREEEGREREGEDDHGAAPLLPFVGATRAQTPGEMTQVSHVAEWAALGRKMKNGRSTRTTSGDGNSAKLFASLSPVLLCSRRYSVTSRGAYQLCMKATMASVSSRCCAKQMQSRGASLT